MATETEKIRIRMEAYDHRALDTSAKEIVEQLGEFFDTDGKVLLVGLGNYYRSDDAAGLMIVENVREILSSEAEGRDVSFILADMNLLNRLGLIEKIRGRENKYTLSVKGKRFIRT